MYYTIKTLWEKGKNKSYIARYLKLNWRTVRKAIKLIKEGKEFPEKKPHPKILDPYKEKILEFLEEGLSGVRIHEKLKSEGEDVGYSTLKKYISFIKKRQKIFIRIHTDPAEEAQVDFGYVGYTIDNNGKRRKTWVFNMRLSYSRLDYFEKVYNQKVETFINCHINAFKYFKGVPKSVRIDNLKAAILKANFYEPIYQKLYKSFSEHYKFDSIPCRVYKPNDKGKTEAGVKYVKNNFFAGRSFLNGDDLDRQLKNWLDRTCNSRVHGTTKKVPFELFEKDEKNKLIPLPNEEFQNPQVGTRKVYHDCHIYVNHSYYSVPFEYVGKNVEIKLAGGILRIYHNHKEIALHQELKEKGGFRTIEYHYPKYKRFSETEYQERYQIKMKNIGSYGEQIFFLILQNKPKYWIRIVQGILSLEKKYSKEALNLSCKRALAFNVCDYKTIKNICKNEIYKLPVEFKKESYEYYKK
jgi:transposase